MRSGGVASILYCWFEPNGIFGICSIDEPMIHSQVFRVVVSFGCGVACGCLWFFVVSYQRFQLSVLFVLCAKYLFRVGRCLEVLPRRYTLLPFFCPSLTFARSLLMSDNSAQGARCSAAVAFTSKKFKFTLDVCGNAGCVSPHPYSTSLAPRTTKLQERPPVSELLSLSGQR